VIVSRQNKIDVFLDGHYLYTVGCIHVPGRSIRCIDAVNDAVNCPEIIGKVFVAKMNGGAGKITVRFDKYADYRG